MSDSDSGSATPRSATPSPPASPDYIPENPEYNPESPGYMPRSPGYSPRSPDSNPESPPNSPRQERVEPVSLVACGGFELYLATGSKIKIDKLFGLVSKRDNSVFKFRLIVKCPLNCREVEFDLIYLGEIPINCKVTIDQQSYHLKNMSSLYKSIWRQNKYRFTLEVGQNPNSSYVPTCFEHKFNDQSTSDFIVKCQEEVFYVHQFVLSSRSEYFSALLRNDYIENKKKELVLDDNDPKIIEILLRYIYNNTIPLVNWYLTVKKILQVADKYQFSELFDTCDSYLAQQFPFLLNGKKNGTKLEKDNKKEFLKLFVGVANMMRAPKLTASIFQKRIENAHRDHPALEPELEEFWASLINKNPDFAQMAAKTTRRDYHSWLEQHKTWSFTPYVNKEYNPNDLVIIVGPHGEMKGAVQCQKV